MSLALFAKMQTLEKRLDEQLYTNQLLADALARLEVRIIQLEDKRGLGRPRKEEQKEVA